MQIDYHRPSSKGVTQLMYVGDDAATAVSGAGTYRWWLVVGGVFALGWWFGKRR